MTDRSGIVIVGGTGFIGRHVCEKLQLLNYSAYTLSRNPDSDFIGKYAPLIQCAIIETELAESILKDCKVLVYLASSSLPGANWDNPAAELEYSSSKDVRFFSDFTSLNPEAHIIYASSGGQIYGSGHSAPIKESVPSTPQTAYAFGKQVVETALSFLSLIKGSPVTILRIANPVGRWQVGRKHGFISAAVAAGLSGSPLSLYGQGKNVRDYFDADELAETIIALMKMPRRGCEVYNIGSGIGRTENEVISLVEGATGQYIRVNYLPSRPFDLDYSVLDCTKAKTEIGWSPKTTLNSLIKNLLISVKI